MSGIFGRYDFSKRTDDSVIEELGRWNKPYGQSGFVEHKDDCYFGGCYIDRIKESSVTSNPELDGHVAFLDVLLFNREELTKADTHKDLSDEDILFSYIERNGIDALKTVNGDFAGAVYKPEENELILFRDHMGVRPLYYVINDRYIAYSTDFRGLCGMSDYEPVISDEWIYNILNGYPNYGTENTAMKNINCVPPGGYVRVSLNNHQVDKRYYWRVGEKKIRLKNDAEYIKRLRDIIEDSVKRRLSVCEDPVGAELSGGLDSGVIDILINRNGRRGIYVSWSASPEETPYVEGDERYVIKDICDQENIECLYTHRSVVLEDNSRTVECLKELEAYDPDCHLYAIKYAIPPFGNTLAVTEGSEILKARGTKVVFTGHGGDEGVSHRSSSFEMYHFHEYYHYLRYMFSRTHGLKRRIVKTLKNCRADIKEYKRQKGHDFSTAWGSPEIMNPSLEKPVDVNISAAMSFRYNPIDYIRNGGSRSRLDNIAMQGSFAGVKYLIPYIDYRVIDYAVSIPRYMYLRGRRNRYIFREAFKDIMPESLYSQKVKSTASLEGGATMEEWFEIFDENRRYVYNRLDREMWKKYLNFDFLDKWIDCGLPDEAEYQKTEAIYANLFNCLLIQNTLEKSRLKK